MSSSLTSRQLPLLVGVAAGYVLAVVTHAAWAGSGNASATGGAAMRRPVGELRSTSTYKISTLRLPPASISAASPHRERLLIVSTMTYEHMYRRPNLARTALQLRAAGYDDLVWIIIEVRVCIRLCIVFYFESNNLAWAIIITDSHHHHLVTVCLRGPVSFAIVGLCTLTHLLARGFVGGYQF